MLVIRLFYLNVIEIVYGLIRYLINDEVIVGVNNEFFIILVKFIVVFNNVFEMWVLIEFLNGVIKILFLL